MNEFNPQWQPREGYPNEYELTGLDNDGYMWAKVHFFPDPDEYLWSCGNLATAGRMDGTAKTLEEAQELAQKTLLVNDGIW